MRKLTNEIIEQIQSLRKIGHSLPEISHLVLVSKTTVLRYIKDVDILPEYISTWAGKRGGSRKRKLLKENQAFEEALIFVGDLTNKEKLLFLSAIYWGEGSKKDFELINSNPDLIKIFVQSLREILYIEEDRIRPHIRIYEDMDIKVCLSYWSNLLNIPTEMFGRTDILIGKKKGKLKYGMCRVRILKGGDLLKQIVGINKAVVQAFVPVAQLDRASRS